ncbi:hypothetical protein KJI95_02095 [Shewanella sp. JM162201]|uniref:Uncharacterized protein n=1 Tax=Shewanella jiangmenensis TaxID=2837387 RepID=A0ABS5UYY2_9GAMM|nr:hypothetical protein [Shewanella jiangmenensis]MBT1443320.1 hypothetical protein [Shewanella jiangmenensis]
MSVINDGDIETSASSQAPAHIQTAPLSQADADIDVFSAVHTPDIFSSALTPKTGFAAGQAQDNSFPSPKLSSERGYRAQLLQQLWQRDFRAEYVLMVEFLLPPSPSLLPQTVKALPPQRNWPDFVGQNSLRCGGWKDANLRFRFVQSA